MKKFCRGFIHFGKQPSKLLLFAVLIFFCHSQFLSQNRLLDLMKCKIVCTGDTLKKCSVDCYKNLTIYVHLRQNEYFTDRDTLKKDFVVYNESKLTFDDLLKLKQSTYTVSFELESIYFIGTKKDEFLVLEGFNTFQIGSDQQTFYIVLKIYNERIEVVSSYISNSEVDSNSIRVLKRNKVPKLKHKKLILLK